MKAIQIDELADEVSKVLEEYAGATGTVMKEAVRSAAETVKKEIRNSAPSRTGKYKKSWTVKKTYEDSERLEMVVHSKDRYQLAHLLEHGHAKRNGGRTRAFPHIAPAEEKGIQQLEEAIRNKL